MTLSDSPSRASRYCCCCANEHLTRACDVITSAATDTFSPRVASPSPLNPPSLLFKVPSRLQDGRKNLQNHRSRQGHPTLSHETIGAGSYKTPLGADRCPGWSLFSLPRPDPTVFAKSEVARPRCLMMQANKNCTIRLTEQPSRLSIGKCT